MRTFSLTQEIVCGRKVVDKPNANRRVFRASSIAAALVVFAAMSSAAQSADIIWVEEHWQLTIGAPDPESSSPQVSMVMSPLSTLDGDFFVFTLNHHSYPDFHPGGMQIQHWNSEGVTSHVGDKEGCLNHSSEVITWVQRLSVANGVVTYEILSGQSETWGDFGGTGQLHSSFASSLTNLNQYDPGLSVSESGVNYAGNRVSSLILTRLRWATAQGDVQELQAPIDVDTDLDP